MAKKSKAETSTGAPVGIDLAEVERILAFMAKHDLEEFEFEREGIRVRLKKASAPVPLSEWPSAVPAAGPPSHPGAAPDTVAARPASAATRAAAAPLPHPSAEVAPAEDVHVIKSPIVGTCYLAPSPEADPFVKLGAHVKVGQALCIVEAMKLMNEIEADVAGEVVKIYVENAHPVEYGEPLFGIRTSSKK